MKKTRKMERAVYLNKIISSEDYDKFPDVSEDDFAMMETVFYSQGDRVYIFPYVVEAEEPYILVYIWDCMLYPEVYKRFIICNGCYMNEEDEDCFMQYINAAKKGSADVDENDMNMMYKKINELYPGWYYGNYDINHIGDALFHLYFTSHRCCREILIKSGLNNISYYIDSIPEWNLLGTDPKSILGFNMPLKLIKILNQMSLIHNLFAEDTANMCVCVYNEYGGYIGKELPSSSQWSYLETLYMNKGEIYKQAFNRTVFNRLKTENGDEIVEDYVRFFELKEKISIPGYNVKTPKPDEVLDVIRKMIVLKRFIDGEYRQNGLVSMRAKETDYLYEDENYFIKMPETALEMCYEGIFMGNCLMDYIDKHGVSHTTILFLRKKSDPNKSFAALEVRKSKIIQAYGKNNSKLDGEVCHFLEKYAEAKQFVVM